MGQKTFLVLGDVKAPVTLEKTSGESAGPRWESVEIDEATGKPVVHGTAVDITDEQVLIGPSDEEPVTDAQVASFASSLAAAGIDVVTDERIPQGAVAVVDRRSQVTPVIPQTVKQALERDAAAGHIPAPIRRARGVYTDKGDFIDLTQLLADIDEHVKLEGLTVAKSIESSAIPRDRVRGSFYIEAGGKDKAGKALAVRVRDLLFTVLAGERRALVVRWTKRTNQALGIIVASKAHDALVLLEVEWGPNMRKPSRAAQVTPGFAPSDAELEAARDFLKRTAAPASAIATIGDERRELQTRAVELAKAKGELLALPKRHSDDEALAAALGGGT